MIVSKIVVRMVQMSQYFSEQRHFRSWVCAFVCNILWRAVGTAYGTMIGTRTVAANGNS